MELHGQVIFVLVRHRDRTRAPLRSLTSGTESTALTTALENQMNTREAPAMMATSLLFSTPSHLATSNARLSVATSLDGGPASSLRTSTRTHLLGQRLDDFFRFQLVLLGTDDEVGAPSHRLASHRLESARIRSSLWRRSFVRPPHAPQAWPPARAAGDRRIRTWLRGMASCAWRHACRWRCRRQGRPWSMGSSRLLVGWRSGSRTMCTSDRWNEFVRSIEARPWGPQAPRSRPP